MKMRCREACTLDPIVFHVEEGFLLHSISVLYQVTRWSSEDVCKWLGVLQGGRFAAFIPAFKMANVTGQSLICVTNPTLINLGIDKPADRYDWRSNLAKNFQASVRCGHK